MQRGIMPRFNEVGDGDGDVSVNDQHVAALP
jgi:hypothetical protein